MFESKVAPEVIELIRRTSSISGCQHIYSLAPRGYRVGFYFQMRRAVLLIKALEERYGRDFLMTAKIAVIGAGASGIMAFCALRRMQAKEVTLYEASDKYLNTAALASHRLVHPSYNRWPMLGSMDPFTSMPLLNWCAGSGPDVAAQMQELIESDAEFDLASRLFCKHRCLSVTELVSSGTPVVRVNFDCSGSPKSEDFALALVCVGFGGELSEDWGFEDYWTPESVELDKDEHQRPTRVFGTGDGALIDILRCCAKDPSRAWELPLRLIAALRHPDACRLQQDRISDPIDPRKMVFTEAEKAIQRHEESLRSASWDVLKKEKRYKAWSERALKAEEEFYKDAVKRRIDARDGFFDFLERGLKPPTSGPFQPKMFGDICSPFVPTSAPVNKMLLAYLLETGRIKYKKVERKDSKIMLDAASLAKRSRPTDEIVICRYGPHKNYPASTRSRAKMPVRVGSTSASMRQTKIESDLVDVLSGLSGGEYIYFDAMPHPLTLARNGSNLAAISDDERVRFARVLEKFAKDHLAADGVRLDTNEGSARVRQKWVVETSMSPDEVEEALSKVGGLDGVFCGAAIVLPTVSAQEETEF
jgi:hypothetical protein